MYNNEEYLAHHGIFGQRWGKKNGPPYPLDRKVSAKVKKLGRKRKRDERYENEERKEPEKEKEVYDEDRKYTNARNYGENDLRNLSRRFNAETEYNDALQRKFNSEMNMLNANNKRMSRKERAQYERMMARYEQEAAYNAAVQRHIQSQIDLITTEKRYKDLTTVPKKKSLVRRGAEWTGKWAGDITRAGLYSAGTQATTLMFSELFNRGLNKYYTKSSKHTTYEPDKLPSPLINGGGGGKKGDKKNKK